MYIAADLNGIARRQQQYVWKLTRWEEKKIEVPTFIGASSSKSMGCDMKISLAFVHK